MGVSGGEGESGIIKIRVDGKVVKRLGAVVIGNGGGVDEGKGLRGGVEGSDGIVAGVG